VGVFAVFHLLRTGLLSLVATAAVLSISADAALAQTSSTTDDAGGWNGPHPSVLYLPALDLSGGGIYEDKGAIHKLSYVGRVAAGVHRLSQRTLLTLSLQGSREGRRWVMGMDAEITHLRSGLGLQVTSLRDLSLDRWGGHGALVVSYLRAGVSWYDGGLRVYSLTARVPLTLLGSWLFGGL
jgi:hypothetical protein